MKKKEKKVLSAWSGSLYVSTSGKKIKFIKKIMRKQSFTDLLMMSVKAPGGPSVSCSVYEPGSGIKCSKEGLFEELLQVHTASTASAASCT